MCNVCTNNEPKESLDCPKTYLNYILSGKESRNSISKTLRMLSNELTAYHFVTHGDYVDCLECKSI